jgi:exopolyphosphatase/guanosine-5'-triphosphate,3'-diphosphate pyrophosphatase
MVRLQRRKYLPELIEDSVYVRSDALGLMTRLLRLAVLLNRGRMPTAMPPILLKLDAPEIMILEISKNWLEDHPLTAADLNQEVDTLATAGHQLRIIKT